MWLCEGFDSVEIAWAPYIFSRTQAERIGDHWTFISHGICLRARNSTQNDTATVQAFAQVQQ